MVSFLRERCLLGDLRSLNEDMLDVLRRSRSSFSKLSLREDICEVLGVVVVCLGVCGGLFMLTNCKWVFV